MDVLLLGVSCFIHFLRVELEKEGDAVGIGRGRREAIRLVNERIEVRVGLHEVGRHRERVVYTVKGKVKIRTCEESPFVIWTMYNIVNSDEVTIYVPSGGVKYIGTVSVGYRR